MVALFPTKAIVAVEADPVPLEARAIVIFARLAPPAWPLMVNVPLPTDWKFMLPMDLVFPRVNCPMLNTLVPTPSEMMLVPPLLLPLEF